MKEQNKHDWLSVLETTNIDKKYYDKVLSYIDMYFVNENLYGNIDVKVLPLTFHVLSLIDLDKVEFVGYPMDTDNYMIEFSDEDSDHGIVNEISQAIQSKINEGHRAKIYRVIQNIVKYDGRTQVHFRIKFYK